MKHLQLTDTTYNYLFEHSVKEHPVLKKIRNDNQYDDLTMLMQIAPEQGQFMAFLVKLLAVKNIIEIGTSTGYSTLAMALAMSDDGKLISCDVNNDTAEMAQQYFLQAGVKHKITLKIAPALETLDALIKNGKTNSFDLAFIDADKTNYDAYYEACLLLIKVGGVILIDNVLWGGTVVDETNKQEDTLAIRALNKKLYKDERIEMCMLPLADGLSLVRKKSVPAHG